MTTPDDQLAQDERDAESHVTGVGRCAEPAVKFPQITVQLIGKNGNAFAIMGAVKKALLRDGVHPSIAKEYMEAATAGDYDALLRTTMEWVNVT